MYSLSLHLYLSSFLIFVGRAADAGITDRTDNIDIVTVVTIFLRNNFFFQNNLFDIYNASNNKIFFSLTIRLYHIFLKLQVHFYIKKEKFDIFFQYDKVRLMLIANQPVI